MKKPMGLEDAIYNSRKGKGLIPHCVYEALIYNHGNYLKCRHCIQSQICDRELLRKVR